MSSLNPTQQLISPNYIRLMCLYPAWLPLTACNLFCSLIQVDASDSSYLQPLCNWCGVWLIPPSLEFGIPSFILYARILDANLAEFLAIITKFMIIDLISWTIFSIYCFRGQSSCGKLISVYFYQGYIYFTLYLLKRATKLESQEGIASYLQE